MQKVFTSSICNDETEHNLKLLEKCLETAQVKDDDTQEDLLCAVTWDEDDSDLTHIRRSSPFWTLFNDKEQIVQEDGKRNKFVCCNAI